MNWAWSLVLLALTLAVQNASLPASQSLADVARKEAERRQKIDEQGIQVKRIESANLQPLAPAGTISTSSTESRTASANAPALKADPRPTLRSFQTRLQKLDHDIAQDEAKLKLLRARSEAERWAGTKTSKGSKGSGSTAAQDPLRWQILDLEAKLAGLRRDRDDTFQAGRKAGYLPGELEGRGIMR